MHSRENYGLLPPKINGHDPEEAKVRKAYLRAFFESKLGFATVLLGIGAFVGLVYFLDISSLFLEFKRGSIGENTTDEDEQNSMSHFVMIFTTALLIVLTLFVRKQAGLGEKGQVLQNGLFRIESAEYER